MKVFGNYSTFAICYELDLNYGGPWLFGKFCYWIGGVQVGDYELGTSLRDVLICLEIVFKDNGCRDNQELFELPTLELYRRLYHTLYSDLAPKKVDVIRNGGSGCGEGVRQCSLTEIEKLLPTTQKKSLCSKIHSTR